MKLKHIIIALCVALVGWFIYDTASLPSTDDLEGNFKEVTVYRNENNTGPITRIYAVTVEDTLWQQMQTYGDLMPHTKYGNTKVYFFLSNSSVPTQITPGEKNFDLEYEPYVLAKYEKDAMGQVMFTKHPFD